MSGAPHNDLPTGSARLPVFVWETRSCGPTA